MAIASVLPVGLSYISNICPVLGLYFTFFSKSLYGPVYLCPGSTQLALGFGNMPIALCISIEPPLRTAEQILGRPLIPLSYSVQFGGCQPIES